MSSSSPRRRARELVLQGLYERQLAGSPLRAHRGDLAESPGYQRADQPYFAELWRGAAGDYDALLARIAPHLDRSAASLSPVERACLVIGAWELVAPARNSLPRRHQRGGRAREAVRRHRRPQVRERRARQARRGPRAPRSRRTRASAAQSDPLDAAPCALMLAARAARCRRLRRRRGRQLVLYCSHDTDACELAAQTFARETRHRDDRHAQGDRRVLRAVARRARQSEGRRLVRRHDRSVPAGRGRGSVRACIARRGWRSSRRGRARETERTGYRVARDLPHRHRLRRESGGARQTRSSPRRAAGRISRSPEYRNEIELSNPVTSGTGYTILATLVTLYGEDGAFDLAAAARDRTSCATRSPARRRDLRWRVAKSASASRSRTSSSRSSSPASRSTSRSRAREPATRWADGDRRRRAASRRGARVLRLGAVERRWSWRTARAT